MRLRSKMILLFLAVSLIPLAGAVLLVLHVSERSLAEQVRDTHQRIGTTSANLAMDYLRSGVVKLETIAILLGREIQSGARYISKAQNDQVALTNRLNDLVNPQVDFIDLQYWNAGANPTQGVAVQQEAEYKGQVTMNRLPQEAYQQTVDLDHWLSNRAQVNLPHEPAVIQFDEEAWSNARKLVKNVSGGSSWIGEQVEVTNVGPSIAISVPVRVKEEVVGALLAHLNAAPIGPLLTSAAGKGRWVALRDGEGNLIATSGPEVVGEVEETVLPAGYRTWNVVVREPRSSVYAPLVEVRRQAWIWLGVGAGLAMLLALLVSSHLVKPISRLTLAADAMRRGDMSARSAIRRSDEIGRLADAFDQMAEALQALDRAKNEFLSHVSHELRTPLTSMQLSVANLLDGTVGRPSEEQSRALARIRSDVDRLIRMVNELLDIARIEAGKVSLRKVEADLSKIAADCVERLDGMAKQRGVRIELHESGATPKSVDIERVTQIVLNLVDNAVKFTPAGGTVTVRVEGGRISVRDTGIGIPADHLGRIFEPFHQAPQPDGSKHAGAGLGLAISQKLVALHGGTIRATSAPGEGSEFTVELP